jgi:hypothetical protein
MLSVPESFIERHHLSTSPLKLWRCTKVSLLRNSCAVTPSSPAHAPGEKVADPKRCRSHNKHLLTRGKAKFQFAATLHTTRRRVHQIDDAWDRRIETAIPVDKRDLQTLTHHILPESSNVIAIAFPEQAKTNDDLKLSFTRPKPYEPD